MNKRHIVIGTAGHIDHGKSALIKKLTGVDPDRLKEEKERGMTTDLGFAFYGDNATIIDVPGHEKFVRHMVAGASTIDFVLFVIASDDGVMPQTIEHLDILKLLAIKKGLVVITKKDLVEEARVEAVKQEVRELMKNTFLEEAPIIAVSNLTGEGIDEVKKWLDDLITKVKAKKDRGIFRLFIDRAFIIKGFGTIVAGTVLSGRIKVGDTLELLPLKKKVKVRGLEVHNKKVQEVGTGFRCALNIIGAEKQTISRGDVLAQPGFYEPSNFLNASLYLLYSAGKPLKSFTRLRVHLGTKEILGRVVILEQKELSPGEKAMVQFRLESPVVSDVNDRYVIRTYSPQRTIGGGVIIEPKAVKVKGFDEKLIQHLQRIEAAEPVVMVEENLLLNFELPRKVDEISYELNLDRSEVNDLIAQLIKDKKIICIDKKRSLYYHRENYEKLKKIILENLAEYHKKNPAHIGMSQQMLLKKISPGLDKSLLNFTLWGLAEEKKVRLSGDKVCLFDFAVKLEPVLDRMAKAIEDIYLKTGYKTPGYDELKMRGLGPEKALKQVYQYLLDSGVLIQVGEARVFHRKYVEDAERRLVEFLRSHNEIRVSQFRDLIGATRKYALPLLVYFDTNNVTIKRGEVRVLGQKYR